MRFCEFRLIVLLFVIDFIFACTKARRAVLNPRKIRIKERDIQEYKTEDDFKNIRIHVDWSSFDPTVKDTNQIFAKAIKSDVIPRTIEIFKQLVKVRRLLKPLKFPNMDKCDMYDVPQYLQTTGVEADLVIFPIIEKTGLFIQEKAEAAALYCAQSSLDGRPIMGFIEFRPDLLAGEEYHIDYHIWLTLHELSHVFAFNESLFGSYVNPKTLAQLGEKNVWKAYKINGKKMNFVITPKVRELASKHFDCKNAIGVPLENKGGAGTRDGHWNRKAMNGDYMIGKSFGENIITTITLALFEDSGWYKVNYDLANNFIWGKNKGCKFLYCKDCFSKKKVSLKNNIFKIKSKYPNEFCSNFNNPVCSTHNMFRGTCEVSENGFDHNEVKVMPFTERNFGGGDYYMDYCPSASESKESQIYYGGSCRLGTKTNLQPFEKICSNCACAITDINPKEVSKIAKKKGKRIKWGNAHINTVKKKVYFKKAPNLRASCVEFKCESDNLYLDILGKSILCNKRYIKVDSIGKIKCPLKALICHPKYNCKFGCVERYK